MLTTLTSKGQLTLPKSIRDRLGLDAGSKLDFVLEPDGTIRGRAISGDPLDVARILPAPPRGKHSDAEIAATVRRRADQRFLRGAG